MPVSAQAVPFLIPLVVLAVGAGFIFPWAALPCVLLALFVLFFFRDPERLSPVGDGLVLAPADGRVTEVRRDPRGATVSIFLSLFDCHINRSPVAGHVRDVVHTPGRFHPAWQNRASNTNERNHLVIDSPGGEYGVTQVAGVLARRIVCRKRAGDPLARGERIGLIRFGSRTDLRLPPGVEPLVGLGDRVRGGLTVVAREAAATERSVVAGGRR
ncbi:MAG TPA: phosphatidylserine decarboxylase [Candidatus Polarisedimenticolia bacterium]|nr:phosphatidylserine decarboxylase [Candidatus Polarisedimenticolia bacterium]